MEADFGMTDALEQLRLAREAVIMALDQLTFASKAVADAVEGDAGNVRPEERPRTVTPRVFAQLTGLPRDRIYQMLDTGQLRGIRLDGGSRWYVPVSEAERIVRDLQQGGEP